MYIDLSNVLKKNLIGTEFIVEVLTKALHSEHVWW